MLVDQKGTEMQYLQTNMSIPLACKGRRNLLA